MTASDLQDLMDTAGTFRELVTKRQLGANFASLSQPVLVTYFWASPIFTMARKMPIVFDFDKVRALLRPADRGALETFARDWKDTAFFRRLTSKGGRGVYLAFTTLQATLDFLNLNKAAVQDGDPKELRRELFQFIGTMANPILMDGKTDTGVFINNVMGQVFSNGSWKRMAPVEAAGDSGSSDDDERGPRGPPGATMQRFLPGPSAGGPQPPSAPPLPTSERFVAFQKDELAEGVRAITSRIAYLNKFSTALLSKVMELTDAILGAYNGMNLPGMVENFRGLASILRNMRGVMNPQELKTQKDLLFSFQTDIKQRVQALGMRITDIFEDANELIGEIIVRSKQEAQA